MAYNSTYAATNFSKAISFYCLEFSGPEPPSADELRCCVATRQTGHSLHSQTQDPLDFTDGEQKADFVESELHDRHGKLLPISLNGATDLQQFTKSH